MRSKESSQILTTAFEKLSLASTLTAITTTVAEAARALTGADGSTFVLRDGDKCYYADENAISPLWKGHRFPMEACISGWSMLRGETVVIPDIYLDARIPQSAYRPTFVKSLCMVPIRPAQALGSIGTYWGNGKTPSNDEIKVLQILANSTSVALENLDLKQDVHKQASLTGRLKTQNRELEAAMLSLAHDLRTPVSGMTSLAELVALRMHNHMDPTSKDFIQAIVETGRRTAMQIERMLSLYRATNGELQRKEVNLSQMAQDTLKQLRPQYPDRVILANIEPNLTTFADSTLMHLVLENLLSNAIKYSSRKPESQIEIGCAERAPSSRTFFVRDNGDGFDPTEAHKLFKPLSRLHSEDDFAGTGLGLVSVAKIIELHGGEVRAEGKRTEGATFYFSLPGSQPL